MRIITHSVTLVEAARQGDAELLCVGGNFGRSAELLPAVRRWVFSPPCEPTLPSLEASGLDVEEGCSNTQLFEVEMTKAILSRAKRKILLADASKWERPSIIRFAEWNEIDDRITDKMLTAKETKKLRSFGLNLHVARGWKHF